MNSVIAFLAITFAPIQSSPMDQAVALKNVGLTDLSSYPLLVELTSKVGPRLSGSKGAERAVEWGKATMERLGFQNVRLQPCMVPHWERGVETLTAKDGTKSIPLNCCALGGSVATPKEGIEAEVIMVNSLEEGEKLGDKAKGKIVFFNGAFDPTHVSTFAAYGGAVGQRSRGASSVSKFGAVAVLVRSMSSGMDDEPHTGAMRYDDGIAKIPAAAVGTRSANYLASRIKSGTTKVKLTLGCQTFPDAPSHNVMGEIVGSQFPNEVIVVGGHLDSWDKGTGAHDDGAGCVQSMDVLRMIKKLGWKPKRTIRAVLFMNEENGGRGAAAYADAAKNSKEKHIAAIESDAGGFAPRGFNCSFDPTQIKKLDAWLPFLSLAEAEKLTPNGGGGADIGPLKPLGTVLFGLEPESQRYFDYHHSHNDTIEKVNPRELQLGAISMAILAWLISENGI